MDDGQIAVIAEGGTDYLKELRRALAGAGIRSEYMRPPPERCSS